MTSAQNVKMLEDCVCIAVLAGRQRALQPSNRIFEAWMAEAPTDAMGHIGFSLNLFSNGEAEEAKGLLERIQPEMERASLAAEILTDFEDDGGAEEKLPRGPASIER